MPPAKQLNDYPLTSQTVGELENNDQLIKFFSTLGYDVDGSTDLPHATMNMDTDDLAQRIVRIRQIGTDVDQEIQIILFEVRSVTVALTQLIAQRFRQRPGNYLLVLTNDYETLDFVLLERVQTEGRGQGGVTRFVIRPRILTLNRRNPDTVALRVLKRFTFTEADGLYQWDKLRSAYSLAEWSEPDFNNRALFSDYYLKHRLTDKALNPAWGDDVRRVGNDARQLIAGARERLASENEAKTRADLIEPLFKLMGFAFTANKPSQSDADQPDYSLFAPDKRDKPLALALVYKWNRNLDSADPERDKETPNENPGALVVSLLEKGEAPWVIMTNGKLWRLYSATDSNKITNYYEIDLEEALFAPDRDRETAFKYWWLIFRREAFTGFLDKIRTESQDYAKQIGDRLKDRIFKQIFGYFAGGFIVHLRDQGITDAEIDLDRVFHATMTFLYRLMFVLYSESLELVPVKDENGYGQHSLKKMKTEIADRAGKLIDQADGHLEGAFADDSTALYARLKILFTAIDKGNPDLRLPVYNGGLFSPDSAQGQFLNQYAIPDVYLAIGLDRLVRDVDDKTHDLVFIDFKSLGVRQLGSIYEGLLEFKLRIAMEKLAVIKDGKRELYMPYREAVKEKRKFDDRDVKEQGEVYIANTKQERKATGSYYTPDYIVKYIVEHTVGPVLDEKFKALRPRLHDAQKRYRQHKATVTATKNPQSPELFWTQDDMQQLADDCLSIRALDPAMGSGHFLVEVVDYTSNRLIDFLNAWSENPVWALLERTRADILAEMEHQGVSIDDAKLTRVVLLKRSVLKRCVYGVDLNEMAVELAKVSLWLDAFTLGAPLSFLDHHLKWGNSLIGARITEVQDYLRANDQNTLDMFAGNEFAGVMLATDLMRQVSYLSDNTIAQTQQSRDSFQDANRHLAPYKRLLDVYTSRWFSNASTGKGKQSKTDSIRLFLQDANTQKWLKNPEKLPPKGLLGNEPDIAKRTMEDGQSKRFFHWELEFPEVFFAPSQPGAQDVQLRKDGGFDAVVGNPPYGLFGEQSFISESLKSTAQNGNIYVAFMEHVIDLLANNGYSSFIVPLSWQTGSGYSDLRAKLLKTTTLQELINLPFNVFPDAYVDTGIFVLAKGNPALDHPVRTFGFEKELKGMPNLAGIPYMQVHQDTWRDGRGIIVLNPLKLSLLRKVSVIVSQNDPLSHLTTSARGILTKDEFVSEHPKGKGNWQSFFTGVMDRYDIETPNLFVLYGENLTESPASFSFFEGKRLLIRRLVNRSDRMMANAVTETFVIKKDIYSFKTTKTDLQIEYLAALTNSSLFSFIYLEQDTNATKDDFRQITLDGLRTLPIRHISFTTPTDRRTELADKSKKLYTRSLTEGHASVLEFTTHQLSVNETDVIHDLLAFLAQQMIDLNKHKQIEVKRFLTSLEKKLQIKPDKDDGKGIDSLKKKSYIQGYLGDYQKGEPEASFADFYFWLHDNRTRFGATLTAIKAELEDEYRKSLDVLLPIKAQLATTDALIDRVVYQLYGLTEDEIRLIEYPGLEQTVNGTWEKVSAQTQDKAQTDDTSPIPEEAAVDATAAMVREVVPAAENYLARSPEDKISAALQSEIANWQSLSPAVQALLMTNEIMLTYSSLPTYTPVAGAYGSIAEVALNEKLFEPFRQQHSGADCDNEFLRKFVTTPHIQTLSLGSIAFVLPSSHEPKLQSFLAKLYSDWLARLQGLKSLLTQDNINKYRNKPQHGAMMTIDEAKAARQWALDILKYV